MGAALLGSVNAQFALNLRAYWDAANNSWNQWVLNYTQGQQLQLLQNLGFESPSWEDLISVLIGVVIMTSLAGALWSYWERHQRDPWLDLLGKAMARLSQAGIQITSNSPPRRVAEQLVQQLGPNHPSLPALQDWLLKLEAMRYAPAPDHGPTSAASLSALRRTFRKLPWPS